MAYPDSRLVNEESYPVFNVKMTAEAPLRVRALFSDGADTFLVPYGDTFADLAEFLDGREARVPHALLSVQVCFEGPRAKPATAANRNRTES